jgi:hypothetical protein
MDFILPTIITINPSGTLTQNLMIKVLLWLLAQVSRLLGFACIWWDILITLNYCSLSHLDLLRDSYYPLFRSLWLRYQGYTLWNSMIGNLIMLPIDIVTRSVVLHEFAWTGLDGGQLLLKLQKRLMRLYIIIHFVTLFFFLIYQEVLVVTMVVPWIFRKAMKRISQD